MYQLYENRSIFFVENMITVGSVTTEWYPRAVKYCHKVVCDLFCYVIYLFIFSIVVAIVIEHLGCFKSLARHCWIILGQDQCPLRLIVSLGKLMRFASNSHEEWVVREPHVRSSIVHPWYLNWAHFTILAAIYNKIPYLRYKSYS